MVGRVLVTGASGFVGQELVRQLRQRGYPLRLLQHQNLPAAPDEHAATASATEIVQASLGDAGQLRSACRGVDTIFHLAAYSHVNQLDPEAVWQTNVEGTARLLEAAIQQNVRRIVYFSSSLADDDKGPPDTPYGRSKRAAEQMLLRAAADGTIEACCLRPVNVYGPGMKGNLRTMIRMIQRGLFPPLPTSSNRLSLVGVDDLCEAALLAAHSACANGQVYCVTDGVSYSMQDVERSIRAALGRPQPRWTAPRWLLYVAALQLEVLGRLLRLKNAPGLRSYKALTAHNLCSNEKISHELGYTPAATFQSALPRILQHETTGQRRSYPA